MKKTALNKETLMEKYSDYVLSNGKKPENVFIFAKNHGFTESEFYNFFASFESLEAAYFEHFFEQSLALCQKIENYNALSAKEQLLNFYYILFENFNLNRSLVLYLWSGAECHLPKKLRGLKNRHQEWVQSLPIDTLPWLNQAPERLKSFQQKSKAELLWLHLMSIVKFWQHDTSPGFEKTELYIEKSVATGFEIVENPVIDQIIDLGKFIWKEKFQKA